MLDRLDRFSCAGEAQFLSVQLPKWVDYSGIDTQLSCHGVQGFSLGSDLRFESRDTDSQWAYSKHVVSCGLYVGVQFRRQV